jgi:hypothetical protein
MLVPIIFGIASSLCPRWTKPTVNNGQFVHAREPSAGPRAIEPGGRRPKAVCVEHHGVRVQREPVVEVLLRGLQNGYRGRPVCGNPLVGGNRINPAGAPSGRNETGTNEGRSRSRGQRSGKKRPAMHGVKKSTTSGLRETQLEWVTRLL